jgi:hypothetical protein
VLALFANGIALVTLACGPRPNAADPTHKGEHGGSSSPPRSAASADIASELPSDVFFLLVLENPRRFFATVQLRKGLEAIGEPFRQVEREFEQLYRVNLFTVEGLQAAGIDLDRPAGVLAFGSKPFDTTTKYAAFVTLRDRAPLVELLHKISSAHQTHLVGPSEVDGAEVYRSGSDPFTGQDLGFVFRSDRAFVTIAAATSLFTRPQVEDTLADSPLYREVASADRQRDLRFYFSLEPMVESVRQRAESQRQMLSAGNFDPSARERVERALQRDRVISEQLLGAAHGVFAGLTFTDHSFQIRAASAVKPGTLLDRLLPTPRGRLRIFDAIGGDSGVVFGANVDPTALGDFARVVIGDDRNLNELGTLGISLDWLLQQLNGEIGAAGVRVRGRRQGESATVSVLGLRPGAVGAAELTEMAGKGELRRHLRRDTRGAYLELSGGDTPLRAWVVNQSLVASDSESHFWQLVEGKNKPPTVEVVRNLLEQPDHSAALSIRFGDMWGPWIRPTPVLPDTEFAACKDKAVVAKTRAIARLRGEITRLEPAVTAARWAAYEAYEKLFGYFVLTVARGQGNRVTGGGGMFAEVPFAELIKHASDYSRHDAVAGEDQLNAKWMEYDSALSELYKLREQKCPAKK